MQLNCRHGDAEHEAASADMVPGHAADQLDQERCGSPGIDAPARCVLSDGLVENARLRPKLYKGGRVKGPREIVVRPNYVPGRKAGIAIRFNGLGIETNYEDLTL